MKCRSKPKERNDGSQFVQNEESGYVSQRCMHQWCSIPLQKFGKTLRQAYNARSGLFRHVGLDIIRLDGEKTSLTRPQYMIWGLKPGTQCPEQ